MRKLARAAVAASLLAAGLALPAGAIPLWTESIDGDLSNNRLAPTAVSINATGSYTLIGTMGAGDLEYLAVTLAPGLSLQTLQHVAYVSTDAISFIAVQNSPTFTEPPLGTDIANLLGWTHFGAATVATNILDDICAGAFAIGCTPPLGASTYSWWLQQASGSLTSYTLNFNVNAIPEPGTLPLIGLGLAVLAAAKRRTRLHA